MPPKVAPVDPAKFETIAFSNSIRLTSGQWAGVAFFTLLFILLGPTLWQKVETFALESDYRMPRDLGYDYWLYERYAGLAAARYDTLIVGDSVVWGEYTRRTETLSHYLNARVGKEKYANLGLDGAHPLALAGLIEHYAGGVRGKNVVVQCNPMWLREPKTDLQDEKSDVNHPRLIPQFSPHIPNYREEISPRLGVLVEQRLPFSKWTSHLQQTYYGADLPSWTKDHPYENPLGPLLRGLPPPDDSLSHLPQPWYERGITTQDFPWVDLQTSLQWPAFQRVVETLQQRGNRVFVVVGPFNEHMLTPPSLERYRRLKVAIANWLTARQVAHAVPAALPSALYGDASHPLASGYDMLAGVLLENPAFPRTP